MLFFFFLVGGGGGGERSEKGHDAGFGVGVVEPVCAGVGGVGGVVGEFGFVEGVPAERDKIRLLDIFMLDGGCDGDDGCFAYYSFVPSLEGGRWAGLLDEDVIVVVIVIVSRVYVYIYVLQ